MRTIFIWDVHGCIEELKELISKINPQKDDRTIFLGDLINKWPDSVGVVKFVYGNGYECVCGNHEMAYRKFFETKPRFQKIREGLSQAEHDWLMNLPAFIDDEKFIAVHGGIAPGRELKEEDLELLSEIRTWNQADESIWWSNDPAWHSFYQGTKPVFYGHWAVQRLALDKNNTFGLDDGCVYGGNLCAYVLENKELISVPAKQVHEKIATVLIIAHNEEKNIGTCLESLKNQSIQPLEYVLIAHNCSDTTVKIAQNSGLPSLRIIEHNTEEVGPVYARIKGFEVSRWAIIACIDGDSMAKPNWLQNITKPFSDPNVVGVGWLPWFYKSIIGNLITIRCQVLWSIFPWAHYYFWGMNFAVKKSAYVRIGGFSEFASVEKRLGLEVHPDDCYLSLNLERVGKIRFSPLCPDGNLYKISPFHDRHWSRMNTKILGSKTWLEKACQIF